MVLTLIKAQITGTNAYFVQGVSIKMKTYMWFCLGKFIIFESGLKLDEIRLLRCLARCLALRRTPEQSEA